MAEKQNRFLALVIPAKDVEGFFEKHPEVEPLMKNISDAYAKYRKDSGRNPYNKYLIVNQDEEYIDEIWDVILKGEDKKIDSSTPNPKEGSKSNNNFKTSLDASSEFSSQRSCKNCKYFPDECSEYQTDHSKECGQFARKTL